tara:strand:+ start:39490 stop:40491 length:1002 start_codon:yes stop_codon:yes gene_type:complete
MSLTENQILGWSRICVLLLGMGWAAWMDHKERRVKNEHWLVWVKPALFLWALDLMNQGADWTIYLTASAAVAYASGAVIGRPTFSDFRAGSRMDQVVVVWYLASLCGLIFGAIQYQAINPIDVLIGNETGLGALWWSTFAVIPLILLIDLAWRVRMLHGGADAKALMWVALLIPNWSTMPLSLTSATNDALFALPPAFSLLMWGGISFLFIPFILLFTNLSRGHIRSLSDLMLAWHASRMPLLEVAERHVWLLTTLVEKPDGSMEVYHRKRAPRKTPSDEQLAVALAELKAAQVEEVWVSQKLPLLVFLFPAIIPMVLLGDPMALLMPILGIE